MEQRRICAKLEEASSCPHAMVKTEKGEYLVTTFTAKLKQASWGLDHLKTAKNVKRRPETDGWGVYCSHPEAKRKHVGVVGPHFACLAPADCPELRKQRAEAKQMCQEGKKATTAKGKEKVAIVGTGRISFWEKLHRIFAKQGK